MGQYPVGDAFRAAWTIWRLAGMDSTCSPWIDRVAGSSMCPFSGWLVRLHEAFLVAEGPDGLYLIDQHAAHERILFERMMANKSVSIPAQVLLEPVTVELSPSNSELLDEQLPILDQLGFQVEDIWKRGLYLDPSRADNS
jgi:DNA mismatch repair ATPase MutL